jgi:hypothetical protein
MEEIIEEQKRSVRSSQGTVLPLESVYLDHRLLPSDAFPFSFKREDDDNDNDHGAKHAYAASSMHFTVRHPIVFDSKLSATGDTERDPTARRINTTSDAATASSLSSASHHQAPPPPIPPQQQQSRRPQQRTPPTIVKKENPIPSSLPLASGQPPTAAGSPPASSATASAAPAVISAPPVLPPASSAAAIMENIRAKQRTLIKPKTGIKTLGLNEVLEDTKGKKRRNVADMAPGAAAAMARRAADRANNIERREQVKQERDLAKAARGTGRGRGRGARGGSSARGRGRGKKAEAAAAGNIGMSMGMDEDGEGDEMDDGNGSNLPPGASGLSMGGMQYGMDGPVVNGDGTITTTGATTGGDGSGNIGAYGAYSGYAYGNTITPAATVSDISGYGAAPNPTAYGGIGGAPNPSYGAPSSIAPTTTGLTTMMVPATQIGGVADNGYGGSGSTPLFPPAMSAKEAKKLEREQKKKEKEELKQKKAEEKVSTSVLSLSSCHIHHYVA